MAQLKNTVYTFPKEIVGSYNVTDYSRNTCWKIKDFILTQSKDLFEYYDFDENETLEYASFKLYGNENYWDILLAINGEDPLFDMYFSFEAVTDLAKTKISKFESGVYKRPLDLITKEHMLSLWNAEFLALNDKKRSIKIIKPHRMQDFMRILRDNGYAKKL